MSHGASLPLPPRRLLTRAGPGRGPDQVAAYLSEGAALRARIESLLPPEWRFPGTRSLDFGCGTGRVLRQFAGHVGGAELWGCDIDRPSIEWLRKELSPPLHVFRNEPAPPLDIEDGFFHLIWATSVFTHIEAWSAWLLELHRLLATDGILIASFLGEGVWEAMVGEPYREDEVGMTVLRHWQGPGADVLHSEWWLREHWGRAFDVLEVARPPRGPGGRAEIAHSFISLRKRPLRPTAAELERASGADPRELAALDTSLRVLRYEMAAVRAGGPSPAQRVRMRLAGRLRRGS